jgi:DNA polymerase III gamma/tau subunit
LTKELVEQFRNIAVVKITSDAGALLEFSVEEVQRLKALSTEISIEQLTLLLSELLKIEGEVRSAINPRYTLELGLLRTSFVKGMTSIENILKALNETPVNNETERPETEKPSPVTEKKTEITEPATADNSVPIRDKDEIWKKLLKTIDSDDHRLSCKLEEAKLVNLTDSELVIGFNGGMSVLADSIKSQASVIQPVLQKISGQNLRLKILSLPGKQPDKDLGKIKEEVFDEPLVKNAIKIFDGSLLRVKSLEDSEEIKE